MKAVEIYSLGENAVTFNFGNETSSEINKCVIQLDRHLNSNPFSGFIETVPAYASLTIFYDVLQVRKNFSGFQTAFDAVKNLVESALEKAESLAENSSRLIEIPVCFAKEFALDLEFIAEKKNLTKGEAIKTFTSQTYQVYMLGFLPGFAYMGETDEKIAVPRKENPRTSVPKGSVGIAGRQTGIYPLSSPGGWQIIGRTHLELFTPNAEKPTLLQTGDLVKFYPIDQISPSVSDNK
jgi:inhibitor of KinA